MLSYVLPTEEKPAAGDAQLCRPLINSSSSSSRKSADAGGGSSSSGNRNSRNVRYSIELRDLEAASGLAARSSEPTVTRSRSYGGMFARHEPDGSQPPRPGSAAPLIAPPPLASADSPKHNGQATGGPASAAALPVMRKPTLHQSTKVSKDESLYSIDSDASTVGSERKAKPLNGPKHANLKRVSFGSSKGSMVETLVYETPVQEEPEIKHFSEHNGRLPAPMIPVPDTDEGREKVRVSLLGPTPFPSTPGVLLLEPIVPSVDIMAASTAELLTAHTDHTVPTYHTQISTDSGWDNPFRPDGDLSREADEIVELIKGGKPITPTPGQNAPALPGYETAKSATELDSSASPLLHDGSAGRQGNGNAHSTPIKPSGNQQSPNEKNASTVEVGRVTAQGPGDASQVEHVTLKKKPKCKCCSLQ